MTETNRARDVLFHLLILQRGLLASGFTPTDVYAGIVALSTRTAGAGRSMGADVQFAAARFEGLKLAGEFPAPKPKGKA